MATNKRDLKAYVRFDGTGRIIPGSLVLRRNKPKVGNWKEIQTYECCDGGGGCAPQLSDKTIISESITIPPGTQFLVRVVLNSVDCITLENLIFITSNITTYEELVAFLNTNFSFLGVFSYTVPDKVTLQVSSTGVTGQALSICPNAEWVLDIDIFML